MPSQKADLSRERGLRSSLHTREGWGGGRRRASNTWFTAHAVMFESQGLGHECRLKNTVSLSSVHDSVNDATSDMGRLDMRQKN